MKSEENYAQANGGGQGWSWSLIDNVDVTLDEKREFYFSFFHYQFGYAYGDIVERKYRTATTAEFTALGQYNGQPATMKLKLSATGGAYGTGLLEMDVLTLTGTRLLFLRLNSRYTDMNVAVV